VKRLEPDVAAKFEVGNGVGGPAAALFADPALRQIQALGQNAGVDDFEARHSVCDRRGLDCRVRNLCQLCDIFTPLPQIGTTPISVKALDEIQIIAVYRPILVASNDMNFCCFAFCEPIAATKALHKAGSVSGISNEPRAG
jgi:hypothetical protein